MVHEVERRVVEVASAQHGVVTRPQLLSTGLGSKGVQAWASSRRLIRLHRGVYLLGSLAGPLEPEHAREMAAVLACGPEAVLSHRSAARLWDMLRDGQKSRRHRSGRQNRGRQPSGRQQSGRQQRGTQNRPPRNREAGVVEVMIPHAVRRRRPGIGLRRAADLPPADVTTFRGIPITTPERTLRDLAAVLRPRELNRAAARSERLGLLGDDDLARLVRRHGSRPGAAALRTALTAGRAPSLTRSEAEEVLLDLVRSAGLPEPETNVLVLGHEVDALWRDARIVVEVDGFEFHSSRGSFIGDRRRDVALTAAGFTVLRLTWQQLTQERDVTLVRLAAVLVRAGATVG